MTPPARILHFASPSPSPGQSMARAATMAENNQAELTVFDVVPIPATTAVRHVDDAISPRLLDTMLDHRREQLEALVAPYRRKLDIRVEVVAGRGFVEAIRMVQGGGYDLLVKPAEDPDFLGRLFGSTDMHLLRKCPCPVWLTRPGESSNYRCVLAAVDFETAEATDQAEVELNRLIGDFASAMAMSDFAQLHIVHAWNAPGESVVRSWANDPEASARTYAEAERVAHARALDRFGDALRERMGGTAFAHLSPRFHLRKGDASQVIPQLAKELTADIVVMGTLARGGLAGLFIGNTAENILEQLQCSVLAIKPPGFQSPIPMQEE